MRVIESHLSVGATLRAALRLSLCLSVCLTPLPSIRQHMSYDDCLEDKREAFQNCSVLYYVTQLHTILCTLI